jgi:hypothetical protein
MVRPAEIEPAILSLEDAPPAHQIIFIISTYAYKLLKLLVRPVGIEPTTLSLEG